MLRPAAPVQPAAGSLASLVDLYLTHLEDGAYSARGKPYSPRTIQQYREALTRFLRTADHLGVPEDVRKLRSEHVDKFAQALRAAGCSSKTVSDWIGPLGVWCAWLVGRGVLERNPLDGHRRPKATSEPVRPFTQDDLQKIIDAPDARTWLGARDLAIVWTLLDTGMRADELCKVNLEDLDRHEWTVRIQHGKGDKRRMARLGLTARTAVGDFLVFWRGDAPGPLFPGRTGDPMLRNGLTHLIRRLGTAAGIAKVHPHRFRHTFAVQFLRSGGDPFRLQLLLGHTSLEMTRKYTAFLSMEDALESHIDNSPADTFGLKLPKTRPR